jgi:very-short-patch-repair endonuclease
VRGYRDFPRNAAISGTDIKGMPTSLTRRRRLRREATDAERFVWNRLRGRRLQGFKFRRQHPLGPYILDFFCPERRLAIELDGGQHFEPAAQAYDQRCTEFLRCFGISVLRFNNDQVFLETEAVVEVIARALGGSPSP